MVSQPEKTIRVVAAVLERQGRYLITRRKPTAVLPNMWEFPGGRCEEGESDQQALVREMSERLGVRVVVGELLSFVSHSYSRYVVDLHLYRCTLCEPDRPRALGVADYQWVSSSDFDGYEFTPADERSMAQLLGEPVS